MIYHCEKVSKLSNKNVLHPYRRVLWEPLAGPSEISSARNESSESLECLERGGDGG